jgi:hypothetical protein
MHHHNVTKNLDSHLPQVNSGWLQSVNITSLSGVRQTRIAASYPFRLGDLFDVQFPHSKFLNPFFFLYGVFQNLVRQVQKAPFSFLAASSFRISAAVVVDLPIFWGKRRTAHQRSPGNTGTRFSSWRPIRTPEENASSSTLLSSECTVIAVENTSGNGSGPTTQYRFMACHSCRGKRRSSSSKLGSEWKPLYFGGPLAPQK